MAQSLSKIYLHIVFSTKGRRPFLKEVGLRRDLHAYLAGACRRMDCPSIIVGGVEDHVHLLCLLSREWSVSELIREIKRESTKWARARAKDAAGSPFQWQAGYGAFSISPSHVAATKAYIGRQEEHHRKADFQEEFRPLLKKYAVEYDERYVWD